MKSRDQLMKSCVLLGRRAARPATCRRASTTPPLPPVLAVRVLVLVLAVRVLAVRVLVLARVLALVLATLEPRRVRAIRRRLGTK